VADILVPSANWTPGYRLDLTNPGDTLKVDPSLGIEQCTVHAGVWITQNATGAKIDKSIKLVTPAGWSKDIGLIQCAASDVIIEPYEVDYNGVPQQGIQIFKNGINPTPTNVTVRNSWIHNNTLDPADTGGVGFHHGIYVQDGSGHHITHCHITDILDGFGLHFYPNSHDNVDVYYCTMQNCRGSIILWGSGVFNNKLYRQESLSPGPKGHLTLGGGTPQVAADVDFVTAATDGYGYLAGLPYIPPEDDSTYGEIERDWIDNEPPGLFPMDQDSLWGSARHVLARYLEDNMGDKLDQWWRNLDPSTVDATDMAAYEEELGIPVVTTKALEARRAFLLARLKRGPFTKTRRREVIESFINATLGASTAFGPSGIPFDSGGIPMLSGQTSLAGLYSVRDNGPYGKNLIANGGFETDTSGWSVIGGTLVRDLTRSKFGIASAKLTSSGNQTLLTSVGAGISGATAGRAFTASLWVYGEGTAVGKILRLQMNEVGGATAETGIALADVTLTAGWQLLVVSGTVAANDRNVLVLYAHSQVTGGMTAGQVAYIDGAQIEAGIVASPSYVNSGKTPFYYEVRVSNTGTPDIAGMTRELKRITPSGISFDILSVADV
jgi:hypothetical protein